jgi:hypothetical protein
MAGLFDNIGEFFTGAKGNKAEKLAQQAGKQGSKAFKAGTAESEAGAGTLGKNALSSQEQAGLLRDQQNRANTGVAGSLGGNAAETAAMANESARQNASQNAGLSSMQAARRAISAARTGGLNQGQAALAAGLQTGQNYMGGYQTGIDQGLNEYNQAVGQHQTEANSLASQAQSEQGLSNQAAAGQGGIGTSLAATGANTQLGAAGQGMAQANTGAAAGGSFLGSALNSINDNAKDALKVITGGLKNGTESAEGGVTLVGEEGPEIVDMPAESKVTSNPQLRKLMRITGASDVPALKKIIKKTPEVASAVPAQADIKAPDMAAVLSRLTDVMEGLASRFPKEGA